MLVVALIATFLAISDGSSISDGRQESDSVLAEVLSRLEHLEAENRELKTRLTQTVKNFQAQIDELSARVNACESKQDEPPMSPNYNSAKQLMPDKTWSRKLKTKSRGIRQVSGYGVAFTAYLDHVEDSLGQEQTIIYNQALLNDGKAYSTNSGIFRAPVPGVYLFSWSVMARQRSDHNAYDVRVDLIHNGVRVLTAVAESRSVRDDNQGSNTAVIRLAAGDEVWTHHRSSYSEIFGAASDRETSFTGVLLYEEEGTEVLVG